jgi:hypothetical protein
MPYAFTAVVCSSKIGWMIIMARISRNARSHTDDTDARAGASLSLRTFDVLITFKATNEKTGVRRPTPAAIATSATLF